MAHTGKVRVAFLFFYFYFFLFWLNLLIENIGFG